MKQITFDKKLWSGDSLKITLLVDESDDSFELFGHKFRLTFQEEYQGAEIISESLEKRIYGLFHNGLWRFKTCAIEKRNENPFIAAFDILCSLL